MFCIELFSQSGRRGCKRFRTTWPSPSRLGKNVLMLEDRRRNRSTDPAVALYYQLALAKKHSSVELLVLTDRAGVLVAGVGPWAACEELAAFTPFLAETDDLIEGGVDKRLLDETIVIPVHADGMDLLLSARGPKESHGVVHTVATGVKRILSEAA